MDERQFLSEATAVLQAMAYDGIRIDDRKFERYVRAVITEYDRRGEALAMRSDPIETALEAQLGVVEEEVRQLRVRDEALTAVLRELIDAQNRVVGGWSKARAVLAYSPYRQPTP